MLTTPTQMRLTATELKQLDRIKRKLGTKDRTATVRELIDHYSGIMGLDGPERKSKKSSVAT